MGAYNSKQTIVEHYDFVSPFYRAHWGEHLHHGYWETGDETKEEAQDALVAKLAEAANVRPGMHVLDVGCGFGASSIYLARNYGACATGITISPVQVQMAREAAADARVDARFELMDAEAMSFDRRFDLVFSIESVSHYSNKAAFFGGAARLLRSGGTLAVIDWFKQDGLSAAQYSELIAPIERGMLVDLHPIKDYVSLIEAAGFEMKVAEDLSPKTARTWDLASGIIDGASALWTIAAERGPDIVEFLRSFRAMRAGYASGAFVFGLLVATQLDDAHA